MNPDLIKPILYFLILSNLFITANISFAQEEKFEDKTLSPYFFVKSEDPSVDKLPLKSTTADVQISGVIADVTVK